jgi:hypothetical protein
MYCQGQTGTQIADNWRNVSPLAGVQLNWRAYFKLFYAASIFKLDRYRQHVFPMWGLDWVRIRASKVNATFNVYNFSRHELRVLTPAEMTEDLLIGCVSLPMWFPPVRINGEVYIDAVYQTDANLEEAIRRGADELWIIWTVSERGEWRDGFVANYFQIIEAAADGRLRQVLRRIEANNAAIANGQTGEFGRPIATKILRAEVPLHYLINGSADRVQEVVARGVADARRWCAERHIPFQPSQDHRPPDLTSLRFSEKMRGYMTFGEHNFAAGYREGRRTGTGLVANLTIRMDGLDSFLANPRHAARVEGSLICQALGGRLPVEQGTFNQFVDEGNPTRKRMLYRLFFRDVDGRPLTLSGYKLMVDDPRRNAWTDTTTLYTRVLREHVGPELEDQAQLVASGIIRITLPDFLRELATFRAEGPHFGDQAAALGRFGAFFFGRLWDVYWRQVLSYGPI